MDDYYQYFQTGAGVHVFILDTGIDGDHPEFTGRLSATSATYHYPYDPYVDLHGHGTAVASVAAGTTVGVAKNAILHSVQIANSDGEASDGDMVDGIDFAIRAAKEYGKWPAVINISFGRDVVWYNTNPQEDAIRKAVENNIPVVVSAGNKGVDACGRTPARVAEAMTVGATMSNDERSDHPTWTDPWASNYGSCLDLFAPGSAVMAADPGGSLDHHWGTSVAAPYAAGALALMIDGSGHPYPAISYEVIGGSTTRDQLTKTGSGSPNRLLYSPHTYVRMLGPDEIDLEGTYTWSATPYGGDGSYSYEWHVRLSGEPWEVMIGETSSSYSRYVDYTHPDFDVRVVMTSYGDTVADTEAVAVLICDPVGSQEEECNA